MADHAAHPEDSPHAIIDTVQSLIVAFVLAMTFRGFVTEGFVIPTGSMAPTLLGKHKQLRSPQTGYDFPIDVRRVSGDLSTQVKDPMLGPRFNRQAGTDREWARTRMGDRILVLKSLFPFSDPSRFDVVVFKNPTDPNGTAGNYIKRLIGQPGEAVWLVDGDVFAAPAPDGAVPEYESFVVQRKPEHVQRAVWQPIFNSDYLPRRPDDLPGYYTPWQGEEWDTTSAVFRCDTDKPRVLEWDNHQRQLNDWAPYNQLAGNPRPEYVNDLRVAAAIVPDAEGLEVTFELEVRGYYYEFTLAGGEARVRMRAEAYGRERQAEGEDASTILPDVLESTTGEGWEGMTAPFGGFTPGTATDVEFWHVDQSMIMFIDGERVLDFAYDWRPPERLQNMARRIEDVRALAKASAARPPMLRLLTQGAPLSMHRVSVDRDIHYRRDGTVDSRKYPTQPQHITSVRSGFGYGTHPDNLAILGPDHFFMAGDNSQASSDSRFWGNPHPAVAVQIDDAPFLVHRKMLLGKAWLVYFPSPLSVSNEGKAIIPDFGELRFIR